MRAGAAAVLAAAAALTVPGSPARACSCFEQSPSAYLASANVVFAGEVRAFERDDAGTGVATVAVRTVYKGSVGPVATVESGSSGDTCGIGFIQGRRYLIFATEHQSRLQTALCSGTTEDATLLERAGVEPVARASPASVQSPVDAALPEVPVRPSRTLPIALALAAAAVAAAAWFALRPA